MDPAGNGPDPSYCVRFMNDTPAPDPALQAVDRSRILAGWPLLLAVATWAIGLPFLPSLVPKGITGTASATLVGFAVLCALAAGVVLLRMPTDPVTRPFVGLAATIGTLLALAPLDRAPELHALTSFALIAPWRYALTPLVVHFALEVGWPHRRQRWAGWIVGWYAIELGLLLAVAAGLVMGETALVDAIDGMFRTMIIEPIGAMTALACSDEVFVINRDGTGKAQLTNCLAAGNSSEHPGFAPNGTKIVFANGANNDQIWTMNPDGTAAVQINLGAMIDNGQPAWQPVRSISGAANPSSRALPLTTTRRP